MVEGEAVAAGEDGQGAEGLEAGGEPGEAEAAVVEESLQRLAGAVGQAVEAGAGVVEPGLAGGAEAVGQAVEVQGDLAAVGDAELAGLAGGQGAAVGGEVGEGDVDLVADGRDDRDAGAGDGPRHGLLVEGPEVLEAAAAAGDDDDVGPGDAVGQRQRRDDLAVGALALDAGRRDRGSRRIASAGR